ncbi:FAD-dependent oxidoreductase [Actinocorallia lasiicapitis]
MGPIVMRPIVVVGNGMAGSRLLTEIRRRDAETPLTVFGAEDRNAYNRVMLSNVLAGKTRADELELVAPSWYREHGVDARQGVCVTGIDRQERVVLASDGSRTAYDRLVLATGSRALVPPIPVLTGQEHTGVLAAGGLPAGVAVFRTLADCDLISAAARDAKRVIVVGRGLLGLEATRGLADRGLHVTVVHLVGHLMERQLDRQAGQVLARTLRRQGLHLRLSAQVDGIEVGAAGASGVRLSCGELLPAELVVVACGVLPETGLARAAGLAVDRGVVVDDRMVSVSDPDVMALGDCAQFGETVYGLVAPAWEQATVLADLLTGTDPAARYAGSKLLTRLKASAVDLASMGEIDHDPYDPEADPDVEVLQYADPARHTYKKVVLRDGRLVGAILLGETSTAGTLARLFEGAGELPGDHLGLLFDGIGSAGAEGPADDDVVCFCNNVTTSTIKRCWQQGARSVPEVTAHTRAGTGCGGCRETVRSLLAGFEALSNGSTVMPRSVA